MSGLAGGSPNIHLRDPVPQQDPTQFDPTNIVVESADEDVDQPQYDAKGALIRIEHPDGSITITTDGKPIEDAPKPLDAPGQWFENLADKIEEQERARIADDLLRGIDEDKKSRQEWIDNNATGLKILGMYLETPKSGPSTDSAPLEGMSSIRHPLMMEATLRFQANARSELLPTDGPVKIKNDSTQGDIQKDQLANALETDLNHYLTSVATEYYPDTDRMLLRVGFGGTVFKKVYKCPIRNRPVSETVDPEDLIVNADATDLRNARRVTHRVAMRPSVVRRMQLLGVYRDIDLSTPNPQQLDNFQREQKQQQGVEPAGLTRPDDRDREIYECYTELNIKGFEHKYKDKESGLEIPYRVTIDLTSREILSIVRNYNEDDKELPTARMRFVKFTFVPGFGFYDIGFLHILGNTTNAVTAAWRLLLDAGMFSNFPGFLVAKSGTRQNTNIFRVPPGGGAQIDTGGVAIKEAIMPLPYQPPSVSLMQLVENIAETGQRVGGTSELQVGEGRAEMPVGTVLAMIEQATKLINSVHKRLHAAQAEEFALLVECFRENPECFWQKPSKSGYQWDRATFLEAINNREFVPKADPNTASQAQRILKVMALKQLSGQNQTLYDPIAVDSVVIQTLGFSDPKQFFVPPQAQATPPPQLQAMEAKSRAETTKADAAMVKAQASKTEADAKVRGLGAFAPQQKEGGLAGGQQQDTQADLMGAEAKLMDARTKQQEVGLKLGETKIEDENRDKDRESREHVQVMEMARDILMHPEAQPGAAVGEAEKAAKDIGVNKGGGGEGKS